MSPLDWAVGIFVTAWLWRGFMHGVRRAQRQRKANERAELRRAAERASDGGAR